ncbi:MAG: hypothetical protein ABL901_14015 [Hyphomicrobiaceae bacterium]
MLKTAKPFLASLCASAGLIALALANSDFITSAVAQSWGEKTTTEKAKPAAKKEAAPVSTKAEPKHTDAKNADFQTMDQLQKAGVKRCLQLAQAVGQATMVGTSEYAAASTWHSKQPDQRFSVSMIGQKFGAGDSSIHNGVSGVFSSPTADGKCDAAAVQIIPTSEPCSKTQAQILEKGKSLGNLAGVPLLQNAASAQVMLIPAANNSCVLVALSTVYTE